VCGGKRRGRAALRRTPHVRIRGGKIEVIAGQDEVYEQTLPPGPFKVKDTRDYRIKRVRPRRAPEASFQIQVARHLAKALPGGFFFTAFPARAILGRGGLKQGAILKAMGLKAGMPDMCIFAPCGQFEPFRYSVCWLELKAKSGSLSQAQKDVHKQLKGLGHQVEVCRTLPQVAAAISTFVFPEKLRARVTA
jgi:hypothetical protein